MSFHKVMVVCITSIVQNHHWEYLKLSQSIMTDLEVVCATLACGTVSCKTIGILFQFDVICGDIFFQDKENGSAKIPDIGQAEGKTTNDPESAGTITSFTKSLFKEIIELSSPLTSIVLFWYVFYYKQ